MPPVVASLVVGDLIRAARDEHPTFDERRQPNPVLLRALSRYQRSLLGRVVQLNAAALFQQLDQALPLADFDAGITIPDHKYIAGVEAETVAGGGLVNPGTFRVDLVPWGGRLRYALAAYTVGSVLHLTGAAEDWTGFSALHVFYVPEADALTTLTATLVLPNAAEPCLVAYLAAFMAGRSAGTDAPNPGSFVAAWQAMEDQLLDEMGRHRQARTSVIREAW